MSVALPPNSHRCRMQGSVFCLTHCPDSTVLVGAEQRLTVYLLCSVSCSAGIREGKEARRLPCSKLISCSDPISSQVEVGSQWVTDFFFLLLCLTFRSVTSLENSISFVLFISQSSLSHYGYTRFSHLGSHHDIFLICSSSFILLL